MARFGLNIKKANNYAFFCPVSRLHLTRSNPIGYANGVTPAILRGLKTGAILDVDNVVDIEKGTLNEAQQSPVQTPAEPQVPEDTASTQQDTGKSGRGRKKKAAAESEDSFPSAESSNDDNKEESATE